MLMADAIQIAIQGNLLLLKGNIDFTTAMQVYEASLPLFQTNATIMVDMADVISTNSVGLSLLVEWIKLSQQHTCRVHFLHVPEALSAVAKAADLEGFLRAYL